MTERTSVEFKPFFGFVDVATTSEEQAEELAHKAITSTEVSEYLKGLGIEIDWISFLYQESSEIKEGDEPPTLCVRPVGGCVFVYDTDCFTKGEERLLAAMNSKEFEAVFLKGQIKQSEFGFEEIIEE